MQEQESNEKLPKSKKIHHRIVEHLRKPHVLKIGFTIIFGVLLAVIAVYLIILNSNGFHYGVYSSKSNSSINVTDNSTATPISLNIIYCNESSGISLTQCFSLIDLYSSNCTSSNFVISSITSNNPTLHYQVSSSNSNECSISFELLNSTIPVFQRVCNIPLNLLNSSYSSSNSQLGTGPYLAYCNSTTFS